MKARRGADSPVCHADILVGVASLLACAVGFRRCRADTPIGAIVERQLLRAFFAEDVAMQITLEVPEDIAQGLESSWKDVPRVALESLALEGYRSGALTTAQLRRLLGFETRMQVDAFLNEHEIYDYTAADFEQDRETLKRFHQRDAQSRA
jgi:hypothetical protein